MEILIVEDDKIIAELHKFLVKKITTLEPVVLFNGQEAISYLEDQGLDGKTFLVLLDINMPVMNGWEFLEKCQDEPYGDRVSVALVTSSMFEEDRRKAQKYDTVTGYYSKPLKPGTLKEIMDLEQRAPSLGSS